MKLSPQSKLQEEDNGKTKVDWLLKTERSRVKMDISFDHNEIGDSTDMTRLDHIPTTLRNLPSKMPRTVTYRKRKSLPPGYKPGEFDVCCGRGKRHWNHVGNVRFRRYIQSSVERYMKAPSKNDKTTVVVSIVDDIRNMGGNFLKEDLRGNWYDIGDQQAREKVGHSLRDQVSTIHRQEQKHAALQQHKVPSSSPPPTTASVTPIPIENSNHLTKNNAMGPPPQQEQSKRWQPQLLLQQTSFGLVRSRSQQQRSQMPSATTDQIQPITESASEDDDLADVVDVTGVGIDDEDDDDAQSDGSNERTVRRQTLSSSMIIDKFARRPSFASAVADPTSSFSTSKSSSKRSSGWSFLNDLDFSMDQFDADFQDGLEPIQYKSHG